MREKFVFSDCESISIGIVILLAWFRKFWFWRIFWIFFKNAVGNIGKSYQPILLILKSKQRTTSFYLVCNFSENRNKIATVKVHRRKKKCKMESMTSFQKQMVKTTTAFGLQTCLRHHRQAFGLLELASLAARGLRPRHAILTFPPFWPQVTHSID